MKDREVHGVAELYVTEQLNGNNKRCYMNLASCFIAIIFISFIILSGL